VRRRRDDTALVDAHRGIDHDHAARRLDHDVLGLEVAVIGELSGAIELLQRAHDREEPVEADALERADLLAQRLAARELHRQHGPALVHEALAHADQVRVLHFAQELGFVAQELIDLVHVEEVDAHAVLAEEDGLGGRLVGADAFRPASARDLEEACDVAAPAGDVADLEHDLAPFAVFGQVDESETAAREELEHAVGADALASFQLDHGAEPLSLDRGDGDAPAGRR